MKCSWFKSVSLLLCFFVSASTPQFAQAQTYCSSAGTTSSYEWISSVSVNGVTNASSRSGYSNFTSVTFNLPQGSTPSATLTPGFSSISYSEYWSAWIDFNKNGLFESSEQVFSASGSTARSLSFSIPAAAPTGTTRMRISMKYASAPTSCGTFPYGEVEDYSVNIQSSGGGTPPPPPPPPSGSYCAASAAVTSYFWISKINIGTSQNSSTALSGYENFTGLSVPVLAGASVSSTFTPAYASSQYPVFWGVWADLNGNGSFLDAGEQLFKSTTSNSSPISSNLIIPASTTTGTKRLRIVMSYYSNEVAPCTNPTYGQVEDYTLTVSVAPPPPPPAVNAGALDTSFATAGKAQLQIGTDFAVVKSVALNDGKILIGGTRDPNNPTSPAEYRRGCLSLIKLNANGSLDSTFGSSGVACTESGYFKDFIALPNGKILILAETFSPDNYRFWSVLRLLANGAIDSTFGSGGKVSWSAGLSLNSMAVHSNGSIVIAGIRNSSPYSISVIRVLENGQRDTTFNYPYVGVSVQMAESIGDISLAIQSTAQAEDRYVLGFRTYSASAKYRVGLLRLIASSGAVDTLFGSGGMTTTLLESNWNTVKKVLAQADGKLLVTGEIDSGYSGGSFSYLARFTSLGTLDTSFATNGIAKYQSAYVGGVLLQPGTSPSKYLMTRVNTSGTTILRFAQSGTLDTSFDTDGIQTLSEMTDGGQLATTANGTRLLVVGKIGTKVLIAQYGL